MPKAIQERFKVIYSEHKKENLAIFRAENQKWGVIINDSELLITAEYDSMGFYESKECLLAVNFEEDKNDKYWSYHLYSINGTLIGQTSDYASLTIDDLGCIFCRRDKLVGLLDDHLNELIPPKYTSLRSLGKGLFQARKDGLYGIIDHKDRLVYGFQITQILGRFSPFLLIQEQGHHYQIDSSGKKKKSLRYSHILKPTSNTYAAPSTQDRDKFKVIVDGKQSNEDLEIDDLFNYSGKWGILDPAGAEIIPPTYDYIDFLRSPAYYKVAKGAMTIVLEEEWMIKGGKWGIVSKSGDTILDTIFDWVEEISENLFAVNIGGSLFYNDDYQTDYWTVRDGKWGVFNQQGMEVVPIEYDCIMLNWFRVKDYLFVQKGSQQFNGELAYDVYDFDGNQMKSDHFDYRKYRFYPS